MKIKNILVSAAVVLAALAAKAETVTIVAEDDWYPYCASKGGKAEGMAVDIVTEAFKAAGVTVTYKVMPYARCMDEVKKGAEVGCFNTSWVPAYDADMIKTKEHLFEGEIGIYAPSTYTGPSDLKVASLEGKSVGITNGYDYGTEFAANAKIKKDIANTDLLSMKKLSAGRTEFGLYYSKVADNVVKENKKDLEGKVKRVGTVTVDKLYLSFSKKHKDGKKFADLLDKGLATIRGNGSYQKIQDKWK